MANMEGFFAQVLALALALSPTLTFFAQVLALALALSLSLTFFAQVLGVGLALGLTLTFFAQVFGLGPSPLAPHPSPSPGGRLQGGEAAGRGGRRRGGDPAGRGPLHVRPLREHGGT